MESHSSANQTSSMEFFILQQVKFLEISDDPLCHWELVDLLDAHEDADSVAVADADADAYNPLPAEDGFAFWSSAPVINNSPVLLHPRAPDAQKDSRHANRGRRFADGDGVDVDEEDGDEDDDALELNDELVPWDVSQKFGRQRMRKLGKRVCPKMNSSKRSPTLFVTPGSLRGKHGLGRKHNL